MNDVRQPLPGRRAACRSPFARASASLGLALLAGCGALTPQDDETGDGDGTSPATSNDPTDPGPTTGGGLATVTIYDIQQGKVPDPTLVQLKDVVVTSPVFFDKNDNGNFFIAEQDGGEYSGIQVYVYADVAAELDSEGKLPAVGDKIDITANYKEFYDYSELELQNAADLTITGAGEVPAPSSVQAADIATGGAKAENYEGCLVQIEGAKVTKPVEMYGEFEVDGALKVDDLFFLPNPGPKPPQDTEFTALVGQVTYSFEEFKLAPRSCADYGGWDGCTTPDPTDTNPMCDPGGEVTIFQIRQGEVCVGEPVTVTGAVVTSGLTFKQDGFYVQDPAGGEFSGIFVYIGADNPLGISVAPGDTVDLAGTYDEFYAASQIEIADAAGVAVTGAGTIPDPVVVPPADITTGGPKAEAYEGVLVRVEGVTVAANDLGFGEFSVDDMLRVDDLFFAMADWPLPNPGDMFDAIVGPLAFSFDTTKIAPRSADDLQAAP
jgi:hypothetical protein